MKRPELIIMVGFILVTIGFTILVLASSGFEGGFVFVFPFFFFGNTGSSNIIPIAGLVLFLVVTFILFYSNWIRFPHSDGISEEMKMYIKYDAYCPYCGEAMPRNAKYCPTCGHVHEESEQLD